MKATPKMTPTEFLAWTHRVKNELENWLNVTDIQKIRKTLPQLPEIPDNATEAAKTAIRGERVKLLREQGMKNLLGMIDAAAADHPAETVRLIAAVCGVEASEADRHTMSEYLSVLNDTLEDEATLRFFSVLLAWGRTAGVTVQKESN